MALSAAAALRAFPGSLFREGHEPNPRVAFTKPSMRGRPVAAATTFVSSVGSGVDVVVVVVDSGVVVGVGRALFSHPTSLEPNWSTTISTGGSSGSGQAAVVVVIGVDRSLFSRPTSLVPGWSPTISTGGSSDSGQAASSGGRRSDFDVTTDAETELRTPPDNPLVADTFRESLGVVVFERSCLSVATVGGAGAGEG